MVDDHEDYETGAAPAAHKVSHQDGGSDEITVEGLAGELAAEQKSAWAKVSGKPGTFTPSAHKLSHQNGGADKINVAGLSGELSDDQPPKAHDLGGAKHNTDTLANLNAKVTGATLDDSGDPRDPKAHYFIHQKGDVDEISVAGLLGETLELNTHKGLPTVHQDAPQLILDHKGDTEAHHDIYTDANSRAAIYTTKPCFIAKLTATQDNVTGDGSLYNISGAIWTEIKNQGAHFSNGIFTAPSTGVYLFSGAVRLVGVGAAHTFSYGYLMTSNRNYRIFYLNPFPIARVGSLIVSFSAYADMDLNDTAYLSVHVFNGAKTVDIHLETFFGGSLII